MEQQGDIHEYTHAWVSYKGSPNGGPPPSGQFDAYVLRNLDVHLIGLTAEQPLFGDTISYIRVAFLVDCVNFFNGDALNRQWPPNYMDAMVKLCDKCCWSTR